VDSWKKFYHIHGLSYSSQFEWMLALCSQEANSYKIAVRPERRRQFHRDLVGSVQDAFDLLRSCLNEGAPDLREQVQYHANESVQNIVPIENVLVTFTIL
jgi:hypothetical protein